MIYVCEFFEGFFDVYFEKVGDVLIVSVGVYVYEGLGV